MKKWIVIGAVSLLLFGSSAWAYLGKVETSNNVVDQTDGTSEPTAEWYDANEGPLATPSESQTVDTPKSVETPKEETPETDQPDPISQEDKDYMAQMETEIAAEKERLRVLQCESVQANYDMDIYDEEMRHSTALQNIDLDHRRRGTYHFGGRLVEIEAENTKYQANISYVNDTYAYQFALYGC